MDQLEKELQKGNGKDQLKKLTEHIRQLRKENKELKDKVDTIYQQVDKGAVTQEERNELRVKAMNGGPADKKIGKIMKKAKTGNGVSAGVVEDVLGSSRKKYLKTMRRISDKFEGYKFIRGSGNKPSMLKNYKPAKESDFKE